MPFQMFHMATIKQLQSKVGEHQTLWCHFPEKDFGNCHLWMSSSSGKSQTIWVLVGEKGS